MKSIGYDVFGNLAVVKFDYNIKSKDKKKFALDFLKKHKSISGVFEKTEKFKGRLRTMKVKHLAGEKTKEILYKENSCVFRFNIDSCYFSPRLSTERKEIAKKVKKDEKVLVLFGGVAPFATVIGKLSKAKKIVSVELGRECSKYAKINVKRNKLDNVEIIQGDVRKLQLLGKVLGIKRRNKLEKINNIGKFDRIIMARPNLKDSFLDVTFPLIKKGGIIHYYGFYQEDKIEELKKLIISEAKKIKKKIKILKIKKAGDIGVRKFRYRLDLKILN
jgi:tRNA (guanine37-N1)-methyltransferase